jgi:hypothetical protein
MAQSTSDESQPGKSQPPKRELEPRRAAPSAGIRNEPATRKRDEEEQPSAAPYLIEREVIELRRLQWIGASEATSGTLPRGGARAAEPTHLERERELLAKYGSPVVRDKTRKATRGVVGRLLNFLRSRR